MNDFLIGLLSALIATNQPVAVSNFVARTTGVSVQLPDPNDPIEREKAETLAQKVSRRAIAMGGTCTGEHGIGMHKLDALVAEHGDAVELMRTLKRAFDPRNILNPGKTVPL